MTAELRNHCPLFGVRVLKLVYDDQRMRKLAHHRDARVLAIWKKYLLCGHYRDPQERAIEKEPGKRCEICRGFWQSRTREEPPQDAAD
jgi:hypothetical protein